MAGFGLSFVPGGQDDPENDDRRTAQQQYQQAVQLLSLRMPRIRGGGALAPAVLLEGPGSMGSPFARSAIAQTQLQPQAMAPTSQPPLAGSGAVKKPGIAKPKLSPTAQAFLEMAGLGSGSLPTPHFTPGITTHDPAVQAALDENLKIYNESPDYGGAPGWTPPSNAPTPAPAPSEFGGYTGNMPFSKWKNQFGGGFI